MLIPELLVDLSAPITQAVATRSAIAVHSPNVRFQIISLYNFSSTFFLIDSFHQIDYLRHEYQCRRRTYLPTDLLIMNRSGSRRFGRCVGVL